MLFENTHRAGKMKFWTLYIHGIHPEIILLSWFGAWFIDDVCMLFLGEGSIPAPAAGAGFSAFFELDLACKKQQLKGERP